MGEKNYTYGLWKSNEKELNESKAISLAYKKSHSKEELSVGTGIKSLI